MNPRLPVEGSARPNPLSTLNRRDVEVLRCLESGASMAQIAAALSVSRNTARTRIRRVQSKLDVTGRDAAVRSARALGVPLPRHPVD
jgi:DNA-binding CsgD family transcriptional regulator